MANMPSKTQSELRAVVKQLEQRKNLLRKIPLTLFKKQAAVLKSKAKRKIIVCSRRSGKTMLCVYALLKTAIDNPGCKSAYIALSYKSAKNIAWDEFKRLLRGLVPIECFKEAELKIVLPNGSTIFLLGADKPQAIESIRGVKFKRVVVDESASYQQLKYLIEDVIYPTLVDLEGDLYLIGTPGPPYGFFYESAQKGSGFRMFRWLIEDNPHLPKRSVAALKKKYSPNSPAYKREILAEFASAEDAVFTYTATNIIPDIEELSDDWQYVFGIDFGVRDDSAIVLLAYSRFHTEIYVLDAWSKPEQPIATIAKQLDIMGAGLAKNRLTYVYDSAALIYSKELSERFGFSMTPAKKQDKAGNIARANSLLYQNILKITKKANLLLNEFDTLTWATTKREEWRSGVPDHVTDAFLYGLRYIYSQPEPEEKIKPPWHSTEDKWEQKLIQESLEKANQDRIYKDLWGDDYQTIDKL